MDSMKRHKDMTLEDECPRLEGDQYATEEEQRATTNITHSCICFLVPQMVKNPPAMQGTWVQSLGWEDSLEEGMATYSSILP